MFLQFISRISKWYSVLSFFLFSFLFQFLLIVNYLPKFLTYSSGTKNPDQLLRYSKSWLTTLYVTLGIDGRRLYQEMLFVDFGYILFTTLALSGLIFLLSRNTKFWTSSFIPFLAAFFDVLENVSQIILIQSFPIISDFWVTISSTASSFKMILMILIVILIVLLLSRILYSKHLKKDLKVGIGK